MVKTKNIYPYEPDYAVAPGEILEENLETIGMQKKELSVRTGLTEQTISRIISGQQPLTMNTANKLELVLGVPARMWNNLESLYREQLLKIEEKALHETNVSWLNTVPWKPLVNRGVIPKDKDKAVVVRNVLAFYGVSTVEQYQEYWQNQLQSTAARKSQAFKSDFGSTSAWIRLGELQASAIDTEPYDKKLFRKALEEIRSLTRESTSVFESKTRTLCASAGVAVCLVKEFTGTPWYGASKWLHAHKAMILLSLRRKRDDQFWFSFFHEASHVLNDSKKEMFLNEGTKGDECEQKADAFAAEFLIPKKYDEAITTFTSKDEVIGFAADLGISEGIVVGRYQYLTKRFARFNDLKRKLEWKDV